MSHTTFVKNGRLIVLGLISLLVLLPGIVLAHATGASFETRQEGYVIDIGYTPEVPVAGDAIRFDFSAYSEESTASTTYTDVWVRITRGENEVIFAGDVHNPVFGQAGFTTVIPESGDYMVSARFQNGGERVVETSFPLTIAQGEVPGQAADLFSSSSLAPFLTGLVLGMLLVVLISRFRKRGYAA